MLTKLLTDLYIISLLDDEPNDIGGLSAAELKAKFDEAGNIIKTYINETLIPELAGKAGAGSVGIDTVPGLTGVSTVQAAFAKIEEQMTEMTQGAVADDSITTAKLAALAVTSAKLAAAAVETDKIQDGAVTSVKLADLAVTAARLSDLAVETAKLANKAVTTEKIADKAVTTAQLGDASVGTSQLDALAVTAAKLAAGAVETAKIANAAVSRAKLANDALYSPVALQTASLTLAAGHVGQTLVANSSSSAFIFTVPNSTSLPVGYEVAIFNYLSSSTKITFASGVNTVVYGETAAVTAKSFALETYAMVALKKLTSDTWLLTGPAEVV